MFGRLSVTLTTGLHGRKGGCDCGRDVVVLGEIVEEVVVKVCVGPERLETTEFGVMTLVRGQVVAQFVPDQKFEGCVRYLRAGCAKDGVYRDGGAAFATAADLWRPVRPCSGTGFSAPADWG